MLTRLLPLGRRSAVLADVSRRWSLSLAGMAAVEFALVVPVLITLFVGLTEVTPAINVKRKLTLTSRGLADLSSRAKELSTAELKVIFGASSAIMRPYDSDATGLTQMVVTSISVTKVGALYLGTVDWSCGWNLAASPTGEDLKTRTPLTPYTVPSGFQNEDTASFILVETLYPYTPTIGRSFTGTVKLTDSTPWPVRGARVNSPGTCPTKS